MPPPGPPPPEPFDDQAVWQGSFLMAGTSWTNNLSWVKGYANVLEPMTQLSARFNQRFDPLVAADPTWSRPPRYQQGLLPRLALETTCLRSRGQGTWSDYAPGR